MVMKTIERYSGYHEQAGRWGITWWETAFGISLLKDYTHYQKVIENNTEIVLWFYWCKLFRLATWLSMCCFFFFDRLMACVVSVLESHHKDIENNKAMLSYVSVFTANGLETHMILSFFGKGPLLFSWRIVKLGMLLRLVKIKSILWLNSKLE